MNDQLRMRRLGIDPLPPVTPPEGYSIRPFRPGDEAAWADIITRAGQLGEYNEEKARNGLMSRPQFHAEGLLFVTDDEGEAVGTACAWMARPDDWRIGSVHMVAVLPEHRGHRLSYWVSLEVCHVFHRWGVPEVYLHTDAFRVAALKVYIDLGFRPVIRTPEHYARWRDVFRTLDMRDRIAMIDREAVSPTTW